MSMENAGTAFALVIAAGAATGIGAAVVFFPTLAKLANRRFLGCSLGLAAGVMLYVSLVDIYGKAITGFMESGHDEGKAFLYTTICFFGGILLMMCINWVVGKLLHKNHARNEAAADAKQLADEAAANDETNLPSSEENTTDDNDVEKDTVCCAASSYPPGAGATEVSCSSLGTGIYVSGVVTDNNNNNNCCASGGDHCCPADPENFNMLRNMADHIQNVDRANNNSNDDIDDEEAKVIAALKEDAHQLMHMGAATALAIAIHNFPEGLVTFVAYTQDSTVGVVLAIGIGIHNIPEGLCVAMPIFYATGSRWKAFMWGILSGVSEPFGALFGYVVLKGNMSGNTYGIMFGLVAGIMTLIAADELLPTAHRYDPKNEVVTYAFIFGMFAIAASLAIFSN